MRNAPAELSPLHLAHPRPVAWKTIFEPLSQLYGLHPVTYGMWFNRLAQSARWASVQQLSANVLQKSDHQSKDQDSCSEAQTSATLTVNPALKLFSFFKGQNDTLVRLQTEGRSGIEALGMAHLDVTKSSTVVAKEALSEVNLSQLTEDDLVRWLDHWDSVGFLPKRH